MARITHSSVKIENTVEITARADPLIDRLTRGLSIRAVVVGTFIGCQRSPENPNPVLMSPVDYLLQTSDEILGAHHLVGKRPRLWNCSVWQRSWLHVRPADVVDALQYNHINDAGLRQHIAIKSRQGIDAGSVAQYAIPPDPLVEHSQPGASVVLRQPTGQNIGPVTVFALLCSDPIRNRITESDRGRRLIGSPHFDIRQPVPRRPHRSIRYLRLGGEVPRSGNVRFVLRPEMSG